MEGEHTVAAVLRCNARPVALNGFRAMLRAML